MANVEKLAGVVKAIKKLEDKLAKETDPSVIVGNNANYAVYVHEINMPHNVGQWKYLETAAVENEDDIADIIEVGLEMGMTAVQALLLAGKRLEAESMKLTPVKTGNLRGSHFTIEEKAGWEASAGLQVAKRQEAEKEK